MTTHRYTRFNAETGEVTRSPSGASSAHSGQGGGQGALKGPPHPLSGRRPRQKTPEEQAAADALVAHRSALTSTLEALSPALMGKGDPPMRDANGLVVLPPAVVEAHLLELPRRSGNGRPGSALCLTHRVYDEEYLLLHVTYRDPGGVRIRTRGVAIRPEEARALAAALSQWADEQGAP